MALRQGIVDGLTAPFDSLWASKFTEVAKYVIMVSEFWNTIEISMNDKKYQSLSKDEQKALTEAAFEAGEFYNERLKVTTEKDMTRMMEENGAIFVNVSRKPWVEKVKDLPEKLEAEGFWKKGLNAEIQNLK